MHTKTALITGGATRLGRAMTLALAEDGFDVAIHYNSSAEAAEEVAGIARESGAKAVTLQADLLHEVHTQGLIDRAAEGLGKPVAVLVNNASIFEYDNIETATRDSWDKHLESNLRAPFVLTQALAAQAPEPTRDHHDEPLAQALVVNMIDMRVRKLTPEFMTYTIAKMGLWAFTRTAAQGLAPRVRVNAIGPGPTLQGARQSDAHFANQRAATIMSRGANRDDITGALRYFLGATAVTGQLLCIDGGQHLGWQTPDVQGVE